MTKAKKPIIIYTWGYRGRTRDDLRNILSGHEIVDVVDVRRRASGARIALAWHSQAIREALLGPSKGALTMRYYIHASELGNAGKGALRAWMQYGRFLDTTDAASLEAAERQGGDGR